MTDPWEDRYSPELRDLIVEFTERLAPGAGDAPTPTPAPGQSTEAWRQSIVLARARADGSALQLATAYAAVAARTLEHGEPQPAGADVEVSWELVPTDGGDIQVRLYRPRNTASVPLVILVHGGGYWMGGGAAGFELNDDLCRALVREVGVAVANVDHRLAPEFRHPVPRDDVFAALVWADAQAERLGVDRDRIALFGISSGGNLAASAVQVAARRGGPHVAAQVLQCPSLDLSFASARYADRIDPSVMAGARALAEIYAGDADTADPAISPGLSPDLSGLPPTLFVMADFDYLVADALAYADRLEAAGVEVARHSYPMTHTIATPDVYRRMHLETAAWLRGALA